MSPSSLHLFVDISSHGFGHLAQAAPILNELPRLCPDLTLTVRSGLTIEQLQTRLHCPFSHRPGRSDFGYVMLDAARIDLAATASAYREQHTDWEQRVAEEAALLTALHPDLVLTDVAYLPLAAAARAEIPSLTMCSLNWADLFLHFFGRETWAAPIHAEMLAAYRSAECFLRLTPAMPMRALPRQQVVAPVSAVGKNCREVLQTRTGAALEEKFILVAFGGFDKNLAAERWPQRQGLRWLIPQNWPIRRDDMTAFESLDLPFTDMLCSVDAVLTKPGYGTFTEAACNGVPVLYIRRNDWPEQDCLIEWLQQNARCVEVSEADLDSGALNERLTALWQQAPVAAPKPDGVLQVATLLLHRLHAHA